jgi:hypothetical protein
MRRWWLAACAVALLAAGCGTDDSALEEQVQNGSWFAPCNSRVKLRFTEGRHDGLEPGSYDAAMRLEPVFTDLNSDGLQDVVQVITCVPRGQNAASGWSSVEAFIARERRSPQQLTEPLLMTQVSCSEVIESLEPGENSVNVKVLLGSEEGCAGPPGDDRELELTLRNGEPVRIDPLSANFLHCTGQRGLAAAGNLILYTRPHDEALLAQFPRDAQVSETDVVAEDVYVVESENSNARAEAGWRLVEVSEGDDTLGCAWMPPNP